MMNTYGENMDKQLHIKKVIDRTCTNKREYSKEGANVVVDNFASKGIVVYYYQCPFCSRYHISRQWSTHFNVTVIGGKNNNK
jgi:hypothetical protein